MLGIHGTPPRACTVRRAAACLAWLAVSAVPVLAWAGEEAGFEPILSKAMLFRVINFAILAGFLYKVLAGPARDFFAQRRNRIVEALEEARRNKEEAEARYRELRERLAGQEAEFEAIRRAALENAEQVKAEILKQAEDKARRIEEKARTSIEQELKKARQALTREAAEQALRLAEERLAAAVTPEDQRRFLDDYIAGLN